MNTERHPVCYTIGHGTSTLDQFFSTIGLANVLVDVRSVPYSRHVQRFNRESLRTNCLTRGIAYKYMGDSLGGRPTDPSLYGEDGTLDYDLLVSTKKFSDGIAELVSLCKNTSTDRSVYLVCAEVNHMQCHRTLVIAPELLKHDIWMYHSKPGYIGSHNSMIDATTLTVQLKMALKAYDSSESTIELLRRARKKIAPKRPKTSDTDFEL